MNDINPIMIPVDWHKKYASNYRKSIKKQSFWKWLFSFTMSKHRILDREVGCKLREREILIEEAWRNHPQFFDVVKKIQKLFNDHLWDFEPVFIPEDSYYLLGQMLTGDLCEIEMIMAMEEEFEIELDDNLFDKDLSMLELVREIHKLSEI